MSNMATCMLSVKTFTFAELEKATDKFSSKRILGEGGFGRVFDGSMEDGTEVAVKLLTRNNQNGDREFIAEVEMLSRLHHRNLVKLIGICIEGRTRCLVYELVRNGSVESHLHGIFLITFVCLFIGSTFFLSFFETYLFNCAMCILNLSWIPPNDIELFIQQYSFNCLASYFP